MVLRTGGTFTDVVYVHDRCGPSEVMRMGPDFAPAAPADCYAMTMTAAVLDHSGAAPPALVAETGSKAYVVDDGSGDLTDIVTSHLLGRGFTLVARLRQAPAAGSPVGRGAAARRGAGR